MTPRLLAVTLWFGTYALVGSFLGACNIIDDGADTYTVQVSVQGLAGPLQIQNSLTVLQIAHDGNFLIAVQTGQGFSIAVTAPSYQTCQVQNGTGSAAALVNVSCQNNPGYDPNQVYVATLTVSGLQGTVVLETGGLIYNYVSNGSFAFPTTAGLPYNVSVAAQPTNQYCVVANSAGNAQSTTPVSVTCTTRATPTDPNNPPATLYSVGGTVTGLTGTLTLTQTYDGDTATLTQSGPFTFATPVMENASYQAVIVQQPVGESCLLSGDLGTAGPDSGTAVTVSCAPAPYTLAVNVTGLDSGVVLILSNNGQDTLNVMQNGVSDFAGTMNPNDTYDVYVSINPNNQICTVNAGSGTAQGNVTVNIVCNTPGAVSANVLGVSGTLVLSDNGSDMLTITSPGTYQFGALVAQGQTYNVAITQQPDGQLCVVSGGTGIAQSANTTVVVVCASL